MPNPIKRLIDFAACAASLGPSFGDKCVIFWRLTKDVRVRLKLASYHPDRIYTVQTIYGRLHFRDNFGDITNLVSLVWPNAYNASKLTHDGVILDAGANIGLAAAVFAHFNPDREIHCFEPLPDNAKQIARNCPTAHIQNAALGSKRDRVRLQVDPDSVMAPDTPTKSQTFDVIPLDDFVRDKGVKQLAFLKIHTEAMEIEILRGAGEALKRTRQIAMETHGRDRHDQVMAMLRQAGFQIDNEAFDTTKGMVYASRHVAPDPNH